MLCNEQYVYRHWSAHVCSRWRTVSRCLALACRAAACSQTWAAFNTAPLAEVQPHRTMPVTMSRLYPPLLTTISAHCPSCVRQNMSQQSSPLSTPYASSSSPSSSDHEVELHRSILSASSTFTGSPLAQSTTFQPQAAGRHAGTSTPRRGANWFSQYQFPGAQNPWTPGARARQLLQTGPLLYQTADNDSKAHPQNRGPQVRRLPSAPTLRYGGAHLRYPANAAPTRSLPDLRSSDPAVRSTPNQHQSRSPSVRSAQTTPGISPTSRLEYSGGFPFPHVSSSSQQAPITRGRQSYLRPPVRQSSQLALPAIFETGDQASISLVPRPHPHAHLRPNPSSYPAQVSHIGGHALPRARRSRFPTMMASVTRRLPLRWTNWVRRRSGRPQR